jgi:choline dehydrogenase-like flavoprotein
MIRRPTAIVVGSGAGGATAARELAQRGWEVLVLEAGRPFRPLARPLLRFAEPLRRLGLLGSARTISRLFPHLDTIRTSGGIELVRGLTIGGSTTLSCGNLVRAERGLREIGLDLSPEYAELEALLQPRPTPIERWRPVSRALFAAAERMGLAPRAVPKVVDPEQCVACGLCEVGCLQGAKWDARRFLADVRHHGGEARTGTPVDRVVLERDRAVGVAAGREVVRADAVVLAAGAIGTARILRRTGLSVADRLWVDVVVTVGGQLRSARQLDEPPMVWYAQREGYILSPYLDILSHYFHRPWRRVPLADRVGLMVKLADAPVGTVRADGTVDKALTIEDEASLAAAVELARSVMERAGVGGPFVTGLPNAGHLGGTVPLSPDDVPSLHPATLPEGLWVADLSLVPVSQGLPTILTAAALALRVARRVALSVADDDGRTAAGGRQARPLAG